MTRILEYLAILLAVLLTAASYILQQTWGGGLACLILAGLWLFFSLRRISHTASACFFVLVILAAYSLVSGADPLLPFLGFWMGLAAWDLSNFWVRLSTMLPDDASSRLEKLHLTRLAFTIALGLALGLAGLFIHLQLSFTVAFILVILAFLVLAYAVRGLFKKDSNSF
jgi:hypothetical protein